MVHSQLESQFGGKTAVITGAASGIGEGLAKHAAQLGMQLVLADIQGEKLQALKATLETPVETVVTDVSVSQSVQDLAARAFDRFGHVDLVFNNAGIVVMGLIWEIDRPRFEKQMAVNIGGVFNVLQAFIPRMMVGSRPSRMINTASIAGFMPFPLTGLYSASKFAIVGLTEALHHELRMLSAPVQVSLLVPGSVKSSIFDDQAERGRQSPAMRAHIEKGLQSQEPFAMSAEDCARHTFSGIANGQYWLIPQPEYLDTFLPDRLDTILRRRHPELPSTVGLPDAKDYAAVFQSK